MNKKVYLLKGNQNYMKNVYKYFIVGLTKTVKLNHKDIFHHLNKSISHFKIVNFSQLKLRI